MLTCAAAFGIVSRARAFTLLIVIFSVAVPIFEFVGRDAFAEVNRVPPRILIASFLIGVLIYNIRFKLVCSFWLFSACVVCAYIMSSNKDLVYFVAFPIAYCTVYLGVQNLPRTPLIFSGDYSYGLYLYAFPFQQLQVMLFPEGNTWYYNLAFALPCAAIFAYFSWRFIEKPVLSQRRSITKSVEAFFHKVRGRVRARN